ncbi:MAG: hypothetical protein M1833_002644 [Piccolia ochrophora]|nr:MAG: hypothetical protein M1833_002644 [Piccolia ochrophora]
MNLLPLTALLLTTIPLTTASILPTNTYIPSECRSTSPLCQSYICMPSWTGSCLPLVRVKMLDIGDDARFEDGQQVTCIEGVSDRWLGGGLCVFLEDSKGPNGTLVKSTFEKIAERHCANRGHARLEGGTEGVLKVDHVGKRQ